MERKSDAVRRLVGEGKFKEALRIAKNFRIGFTEEDRDIMTRGYECMVHPGFYESIGADISDSINKAKLLLIEIYD